MDERIHGVVAGEDAAGEAGRQKATAARYEPAPHRTATAKASKAEGKGCLTPSPLTRGIPLSLADNALEEGEDSKSKGERRKAEGDGGAVRARALQDGRRLRAEGCNSNTDN